MWRRPLTSEDLVEEHLDVVGGEGLRGHDHFVEVALHQLRDDVSGRAGVKAKRPATVGTKAGRGRAKNSEDAKDTSPRSSRSEEAAGCPEPREPAGRKKRGVATGRQTAPASTSRPHVVVFEEAQHPQLSEDPLTGDQVLEDVGHLL